jgi:hypothetical protein
MYVHHSILPHTLLQGSSEDGPLLAEEHMFGGLGRGPGPLDGRVVLAPRLGAFVHCNIHTGRLEALIHTGEVRGTHTHGGG